MGSTKACGKMPFVVFRPFRPPPDAGEQARKRYLGMFFVVSSSCFNLDSSAELCLLSPEEEPLAANVAGVDASVTVAGVVVTTVAAGVGVSSVGVYFVP